MLIKSLRSPSRQNTSNLPSNSFDDMTKFLFMDEKYPDQTARKCARVTSLTGLLVPARSHGPFREAYYGIIVETLQCNAKHIRSLPQIHASNLLPELGNDDDSRFAFLNKIVQVVLDFNFKIYRVGYINDKRFKMLHGKEKGIVGLCFLSLLFCLKEELDAAPIWPVMETDRSDLQDLQFPGLVQNVDWLTSASLASVSIDNTNLGEVLYSTKRSAHGSVVDCLAYLLHLDYLKSSAIKQTAFKEGLANIASKLQPAIVINETIRMTFAPPEPGLICKGPIRYMHPVVPADES